ncbi:uncharacterized protein L3040_007800 [Drepanopeziza brunnea f. sp. 'multigermtubi']|uniref:uncharacterized protein n=1 Tax=Drepanopeziza brunnea f. sp. 'multigermtubi' TaxID=698441 RepID=UPI0023930903|nr:hypothetical protein L3040_007800 [Drepanopeziza brunnea f. sp. 'multigermtubi']
MKVPASLVCSMLAGMAAAHLDTRSAVSSNVEVISVDRMKRGCQVSDEGSIYERASLAPRQVQDSSAFPPNMTVAVNFHIASTERDAGLVTDEIVDAQFAVLHSAFARYNITLQLNSTSRVVDNRTGSAFLINEAESTGGFNYTFYADERNAYLAASRRGGYDALNLYFFSNFGPGATGVCQWPSRDPPSPETFSTDGCLLNAETMPGLPPERAFPEYDQGLVAVHEAGHWFGLNHTFTGGCTQIEGIPAMGDFVDDTPAQSEQYGCPVGIDSCPELEGLDPIHNYMGYTDDTCRNEFTPGQQARMFETFFLYRRRS